MERVTPKVLLKALPTEVIFAKPAYKVRITIMVNASLLYFQICLVNISALPNIITETYIWPHLKCRVKRLVAPQIFTATKE